MNEELNKSIDSLIEDLFTEPVKKASENFEVANASKTTADAALAGVPGSQDDASRGGGRPKQISDVPKNDQDGSRDGQYDGSIAANQGEDENEEAKKQSRSIDQNSSVGRLGQKPSMKDPRLSKTLTDEEMTEFEEFKKAKAEKQEQAKQDEIKKSEDLRKVELETLVKSAVETAIAPIKKENEELKKTLDKSETLIKAMASQPARPKSVTNIEVLEKSVRETDGPEYFTKADKLDAAEELFKANKIPMDAVIELENTGTVFNKDWQQLIERQLQKQN